MPSALLPILSLLISLPFVQPQALSRQPVHPATAEYLPLTTLPTISTLINQSVARIVKESPPTKLAPTPLRDLADAVYRAFTNNTSETNALTPQPQNGRFANTYTSILIANQINDAFVSSVTSNASAIRELVVRVANDTATPTDRFDWSGGFVSVFNVGSSTIHALSVSCSLLVLYDEQLNIRAVPRWAFLRGANPFSSTLIEMAPDNSPVYCEGSGRVFRDHGAGSQRLWLSGTSGVNQIATSPGVVTTAQLSPGNRVVPLSDALRTRLELLSDGDDGAPPAVEVTRAFDDVEAEFSRGLEQYNNVAFLILSVAAMLSSTAVASVSPGADWDRVAVVAVEAAVVYSFLAIVTHACVVFLRRNTFLLDVRETGVGNYTNSDGLIVQVFSESVVTGVGSRIHTPVLLVVTEVFAVIAACVVTVTVFGSCRQIKRRQRKAAVDDIEKEDEVFEEPFPEKEE